jgi:ATP/maltotriose-dependent transcriptional regulator MalT/DNA-binding SARP family transcriptional activator
VPVGTSRPTIESSSLVPRTASDVNAFPIHVSKVQRPALREETLTRHRLLDWLNVKIHHRLVLVTAEAGYGKTTLLADFSGRTRLRTLWYRLDEGDRDWVTVLNYLVAAGREVDPEFAPTTWSMLGELGTSGSSKDAILATFIRELQSIGERGAVFVFDDYHAVEDQPDVQHIIREIVTQAPERLSIVILTRRQPALAVARLRALGEVAELTRDDLRFDSEETERLFRETYGRPLESDVLEELARHTEGWAASLQLVQSALRERTSTETRTFIRALSGAHGTLHDYLAEEVVGELDPSLQAFLMRTSILTTLDVSTATVVASVAEDEARRHFESAERVGLLPRAGRSRDTYHYHKLVRDFLLDRLRREVGDAGIAELHRRMARFGETTDWKLAAHHYAAAGDIEDLRRVLVASIQDIMGGGGFALAESYVNRYPDLDPDPSFGLFLSRRDLYRGDFAMARARAQAAVDAYPVERTSREAQLALANLASIEGLTGDLESSVLTARQLQALQPEPAVSMIARGTIIVASESVDGDLEESARIFDEAQALQARRGHEHYRGISLLNLSETIRARGLAQQALAHSNEALELLTSSSAGFEIYTLHMTRAWALHHLGRPVEADEALGQAVPPTNPERAMTLIETADIQASYGDPDAARLLLDEAANLDLHPNVDDLRRLVLADLTSRTSPDSSDSLIVGIDLARPRPTVSFAGRVHLTRARAAVRAGRSTRPELQLALDVFMRQRADYWTRCAALVKAIAECRSTILGPTIVGICRLEPVYATICADELALRLGELGEEAQGLLRDEVRLRPQRWRPVLRRVMDRGEKSSMLFAAECLDEVGQIDDIARLRAFARLHRDSATAGLGRGLARRLAPRAHMFDLGHVTVLIGERTVDGSSIRRKVLTLACFLLTRPGFTAARDQVLEALWPDLDPGVAVNSLNQTVYFLRRVFEPHYVEDESANYLHHDGDVVRFDAELVSSQSTLCRDLLEQARNTLDPDEIEQVSKSYSGRFAVDFEYEDWASPYRETLHALYLDVIEQALRADSDAGRFDRAGKLARRAMAIDAEAASLEVALLRLYRQTGSHAAAAEQYSHYSAASRDEGIEPQPLEGL